MRKSWTIVLIGVASFAFFCMLRFKYGFAGDNWLHIGQVERGELLAGKNGIGSLLAMCLFYKAVHPMGISGFQSVQLFSAFLGAGYGIYSYLISSEIGKSKFEKWCLFAVLAVLPASFHFHGLIEIHALPILLMIVFYYYAIRAIRGKVNTVVPCAIFAVTFLFHFVAVTLLPAIGFLFFKGRYRRAGYALSLLALIGMMAVSPNNFHPIGQQPGRFELFSDLNFLEFANGQILSLGPLLLCLPFLFRKMDSDTKMLGAIAAFQLVFFFCFDSLLGSANWELDVVPSFAFAVFAMATVFQTKMKRQISQIIVGLMLLHSGSMMALNMTDLSILKFENDLKKDEAWYYKTHSKNIVWYLTLQSNGLIKNNPQPSVK
jgi:hypothetical protein